MSDMSFNGLLGVVENILGESFDEGRFEARAGLQGRIEESFAARAVFSGTGPQPNPNHRGMYWQGKHSDSEKVFAFRTRQEAEAMGGYARVMGLVEGEFDVEILPHPKDDLFYVRVMPHVAVTKPETLRAMKQAMYTMPGLRMGRYMEGEEAEAFLTEAKGGASQAKVWRLLKTEFRGKYADNDDLQTMAFSATPHATPMGKKIRARYLALKKKHMGEDTLDEAKDRAKRAKAQAPGQQGNPWHNTTGKFSNRGELSATGKGSYSIIGDAHQVRQVQKAKKGVKLRIGKNPCGRINKQAPPSWSNRAPTRCWDKSTYAGKMKAAAKALKGRRRRKEDVSDVAGDLRNIVDGTDSGSLISELRGLL